MYNYTYKDVHVKDYNNLYDLLDEIRIELTNHKYDRYFNANIIIGNKFVSDILSYFLQCGYDISCLRYDNYDYDKEYVISLTNENNIYLEKVWVDNENNHGYLNLESDVCYIFEETNYSVLNNVKSNNKIIFGFNS